MHQIASFKTTFSKKLLLLRGAHPPRHPLRHTSATAGAYAPFLTSKIWPLHFENRSAAYGLIPLQLITLNIPCLVVCRPCRTLEASFLEDLVPPSKLVWHIPLQLITLKTPSSVGPVTQGQFFRRPCFFWFCVYYFRTFLLPTEMSDTKIWPVDKAYIKICLNSEEIARYYLERLDLQK